MNPDIRALYTMANRDERMIIGLMSGTSLDGLDIALCKVRGSGTKTSLEVVEFETVAYEDDWKNKIRTIFAQEQVNFPYLALLNEWVGMQHAAMVRIFLAKKGWKASDIDLIASHGQTVMHVPRHQHQYADMPNATLQIGDGDHLAVHSGIITVSDFRQKHLAAGGEGAPLAVYGDYLLFSQEGEDRIMLNMGGIGNFTFLPGDCDASRVFVTDTGPGNTLMDAWARQEFQKPFDQDGALASQGKVHAGLLHRLKEHYFFALPFPKTTGPEVFHLRMVEQELAKISVDKPTATDVMATLNRFSAETIADAIRREIGDSPFHVYSSGGGMHNKVLMTSLKELLPACRFSPIHVLGINGDAKEAVLFAVLANETVAGNPIDFGQREGVPGITMGKISFPK